ncbi:MAG: endonuclease/exonuclease/phosphatase family protein [Chlorobi bacterium]|nr:endonuclease/exonuclease/phosphatase family protein [Chlorobiota bacterium]
MKKILLLLFISFGILNIISAQTIKVITYNIRYDNPNDGENRWDNRKEFLTDQIKFYEPDFLGTQEGLAHQISFIDNTLSQYNYIGIGRNDGKSEGEFSAIFYNSEKFAPIKYSTFWLSETPDIPSKGWDAALNRICTYGLFENKTTKEKLWIFNTHFDHRGVEARKNSAKLIIKKIKELNKENLPVVFMGDLNLEPESEAIKYLSTQMNDTKSVSSKVVFGPTGTFNGFKFDKPVTKRIDYIFVSKGNIEVEKYAVLSDSKDLRYPSDHLPVYAEIILKKN